MEEGLGQEEHVGPDQDFAAPGSPQVEVQAAGQQHALHDGLEGRGRHAELAQTVFARVRARRWAVPGGGTLQAVEAERRQRPPPRQRADPWGHCRAQ